MRIFQHGLGQGSFPEALTNASPINPKIWADIDRYWQNKDIFISQDGSEIVRPGPLVQNSIYYKFYPTDEPVIAVIGIYGPKKDLLTYIPFAEIKNKWLKVDPTIKASVLSKLPSPGQLRTGVSIDTLGRSIIDGYTFAERAQVLAQQGSSDEAIRTLASNVGATRELDKANIEIKILQSFEFITSDDYNRLRGLLDKLVDAINSAMQEYTYNKGSALWTIWGILKSLLEGAALNLQIFATDKWKRLRQLYYTIATYNKNQSELISKLDSSQDQNLIVKLKTSLIQTESALAKFDSWVTSLGLDITDFRKEAGLGMAPAVAIGGVSVLVASVLGIVKVILSTVLVEVIFNAIDGGTNKLLGLDSFTKAYEQLNAELITRVQESNKEAIDTINKRQKLLSDKLDALSAGVASDIISLKELNQLNDPVITAKISDLEDKYRMAIAEARKAGANVSASPTEKSAVTDFLPYVLLGSVGAGILYIWLKK